MKSLVLRGTKQELKGPRAKKVLAVASCVSLPISIETCTTHIELKSATTPLAKGLVLTLGNDCHATMSNAMMRLIASMAPAMELSGATNHEAALVDGWMSFVWHSMELPLQAAKDVMTRRPDDEQDETCSANSSSTVESILSQLKGAFDIVETHLTNRFFLVGESITLADLSLAVAIKDSSLSLPPPLLAGPKLREWYQRVASKCKFIESST